MTKILVIEDETTLREEIISILNFEDFETFGAENGAAGISVALRERPDLILCDVTMPRLDGYGVLHELRRHSETADIPVIFMTARATQDDINQGLVSGAFAYITKPFYQKDLIEAIRRGLTR